MSRTTEKFWHYNYRVGLLGLIVLILLLGCAPRATTKPDIEKDISVRNIIHNIDVRENDSDVSVVITASQPLPYVALPNPLGMDIIFENTAFESFQEDVPVENELVKSIRCDLNEEARSARIKLNLGVPAKHEVLREGNDLIIKYEKPALLYSAKEEIEDVEDTEEATEVVPTEQKETKTEQVPDTETITKKPAWVNRVDFETQKEGKSRVVIETSEKVPYEIKRLDKKVVLVLNDTKMLQYQERPLITTRFKSAVDRISPIRARDKKDTVLITVELREMVPYRLEQKENLYVLHFDPSTVPPRPLSAARLPEWEEILQEGITELVEKKPEPEKEVVPKEEAVVTETGKKYTGQKISLEFQDANIHNVFRILAEVSGQNFVIGEDVKGQVTLKLINVPWDQVMDLVLQMNKLGLVREGNIVRIATLETLKKEKDALAAKLASEQKADPLFTEYIAIKYAKATDIKDRLDEIKSSRGTVTVDERTNIIIMRDIQKAIKEAIDIVNLLDIATPQVLIEARIVEASSSFSRELGIQWGGSYTGSSTHTTTTVAGAAGSNYLVNLPPGAGWTSGIGFNFLRLAGSTLTLNANLLAMESQGRGKIISTPKIATLDNVTATIQQGDKVPYPKQSEDGISVEYAAATLMLEVTPHITPNKKISLVINVKKEAPDWQHTVQGAPSITTKEAQTELLVGDGETVAIGGIIIGEQSWSEQRVPWLSKIPILGWLFKSKLNANTKTELLIFITPKIIESDDKEHVTTAGNDIVS
ncbi:MAG: type IV pilus secretin PilQ [Deltaproteobacteria bacterium]|nr:type IV pilus secretin PilQ [Deltaproteobacteria bacterium]